MSRVAFAGQNVVVSSSEDGSIRLWDVTTGMEKKEAVPDSVFASANCREQQVGRFLVTAEDDILTISPAAEGSAGKADGTGEAERAPVAFFRAPSHNLPSPATART